MAIEWDTRVEHQFTFEQLLEAAEASVHDLLGVVDQRLALKPILVEHYYKKSSSVAPAVSKDHLTIVHGPWPGENDGVVFTLPKLRAATVVLILAPGDDWPPAEAGWDDPEGGVRCSLSAQRDPVSYVLTIASSIAAARTTRSFVWDEGLTLSPDRISDPDRLMARLRLDAGDYRLEQAVNAVLGKTHLGARMDL